MATYTNQTKHSSSYSNRSKNSSTYTNRSKTDYVGLKLLIDNTYFFLIDNTYFLLLGDSGIATTYTNQVKN